VVKIYENIYMFWTTFTILNDDYSRLLLFYDVYYVFDDAYNCLRLVYVFLDNCFHFLMFFIIVDDVY
jgi:hypothetical protein